MWQMINNQVRDRVDWIKSLESGDYDEQVAFSWGAEPSSKLKSPVNVEIVAIFDFVFFARFDVMQSPIFPLKAGIVFDCLYLMIFEVNRLSHVGDASVHYICESIWFDYLSLQSISPKEI